MGREYSDNRMVSEKAYMRRSGRRARTNKVHITCPWEHTGHGYRTVATSARNKQGISEELKSGREARPYVKFVDR